MRIFCALVIALLLVGCGGDVDPGAPPDVFRFDSGGAHHLQGHGAWRVTASRDGRFAAVHDVRGAETVYDEVVLEPAVRAVLWSFIDKAGLETLSSSGRAGVPDESKLTFRLEKASGDTVEAEIWQNDVRENLPLQLLVQELKMRIAETYGVRPVF